MEAGTYLEQRYALEEFVGKGAFATVFGCRQQGKHAALVAKVISFKGDKRLKLDGENEVEILKDLRYHPNIVNLQAVLRAPSAITLVLERLPNTSLFQGVSEWPGFGENEARIVVQQILEAVSFCHSHRIVHRDLSSVNVLWQQHPTREDPTTRPWLRILDFNLSRRLPVGKNYVASDALGHTLYAAPEYLQDNPVFGLASDTWSIGVMLYLLLVGYPPFWNDNYNYLLQNIGEGSYEMPPKYWAKVSEDARSLVRSMLTLKLDDRISTTKALRHKWLLRRPNSSDIKMEFNEIHARLTVFLQRTKEISGSDVSPRKMMLKPGMQRVPYVPDEDLLERAAFIMEESRRSTFNFG